MWSRSRPSWSRPSTTATITGPTSAPSSARSISRFPTWTPGRSTDTDRWAPLAAGSEDRPQNGRGGVPDRARPDRPGPVKQVAPGEPGRSGSQHPDGERPPGRGRTQGEDGGDVGGDEEE